MLLRQSPPQAVQNSKTVIDQSVTVFLCPIGFEEETTIGVQQAVAAHRKTEQNDGSSLPSKRIQL